MLGADDKLLRFDPNFVGRSKEIGWLERQIYLRDFRHVPIFITGAPGVGKTSFITHFLTSRRSANEFTPVWLDLHLYLKDVKEFVEALRKRLYEAKSRDQLIVVLDDAEQLNDEQLKRAVNECFNFKAVRHILIGTRRVPNIEGAVNLHLAGLNQPELNQLIKALIGEQLPTTALSNIANASNGIPLIISMVAHFLESQGPEGLSALLTGQLYDISTKTSQEQIIKVVKPSIISARETLIVALRKQPLSVFDLAPRDFEKVLAELLTDMGYEIELTKATRDGGKDILAYLDTPVENSCA